MVLLSRSASVQGSLRDLLAALRRENGKLRSGGDGYILRFRHAIVAETGRHLRGAARVAETAQRVAGGSSSLLGHDDHLWTDCAQSAHSSTRSGLGEGEAKGYPACAFGTYSPVRN